MAADEDNFADDLRQLFRAKDRGATLGDLLSTASSTSNQLRRWTDFAAVLPKTYLDLVPGVRRLVNDGDLTADTSLPYITRDIDRDLAERIQAMPGLTLAALISIAPNAAICRPAAITDLIRAMSVFDKKAIEERTERLIAVAIEGHMQSLVDLKERAESLAENLREKVAGGRNQIDELVGETKASLMIVSKKATQEMEDTERVATDRINRIIEAHKDNFEIAPTVQRWSTKLKKHQNGFILSVITTALIVTATVALILAYGPTFAAAVIAQTKDAPILAGALVLSPILAAAWITRFFIRLAMQHLSQREDARHREAIAGTYLSLLADEHPGISREERALALAALFRPGPGGGGEDVNPPNWLEVLKGKAE